MEYDCTCSETQRGASLFYNRKKVKWQKRSKTTKDLLHKKKSHPTRY